MRLAHVTGGQTWRSMVVPMVLLAGLYGTAAGQSRDGAILLKSAARSNQLTDLSLATPYKLHAKVIVEPGSMQEKQGELTIYREGDNSRIELRFNDFHQVRLILKDKQKKYVSRTGTLLPGLEFVDDLEDALHLRNWFPSKTKFSERSADEIGGVLADCQSAKLPEIGRIRFCFDRVSGVVVHVSDPSGLRWDFADYPAGGKFLFPRTMRLNQAYQPRHLELKEINVTQIVFDAAAFAIPAGAREFEACGSKPTLHGGAPWDWISNPAKPEVYLYAVVEADGSLDDLRVYGRSKWAEHDVTKKARKKTFTPARCGGKPVAAEMLLRLAQKRPDVDLSRPASQNNCDPYCSQIVPRSPF